MKLIFVTWWVVSGLGKGISAASIWRTLKSSGYSINMIKMDPYLQVDAGTMSPYEHGEVFVTDDGAETDLDMGHYERFTDESLHWDNNITTGKLYWNIITKERRGDFLGQTVQVIPHVTNEIKNRIRNIAEKADICIIEIGGTVWDIEAMPFLEAIRQIKEDIWEENTLYMHVAPLLYLKTSKEVKTKPIQHSIRDLRSVGIHADIVICRTEVKMSDDIKDKISRLGGIDRDSVIEAIDAKSIYAVPLLFEEQNLNELLQRKLKLKVRKPNLKDWASRVEKVINPKKEITIWIAGKYAEFQDAYMSLMESILHAGANNNVKAKLNWIQSDDLEKEWYEKKLDKMCKEWKLDGVIIPGGFGGRWVKGKINMIKYIRENNIPFLGICLWLQSAVIEFARNVCNLEKADSTEFDKTTPDPVVDFIPDQRNITEKWGTMRLGAYDAILEKWTLAYKLYGNKEISERHRHRYEVNPKYHDILKENGLIISGLSPDGRLVEFIELKNHKYFIATQAHPEFKSRLDKPHPLFDGLVKAILK